MTTRRATAGLALGLLALWLGGCSDAPTPVEPLRLEAGYRLLFNDELVGNALFALAIDDTGHYRLEAFTTPAGQIAGQTGQEVLEVSEGAIDTETIRPSRFEHSVMQGDTFERVELRFDWDDRTLRVRSGGQEQTLKLSPQTQDRLSYLLAAGRLTRGGKETKQVIQLASLEATAPAVLQVIGDGVVEVPYGEFEATGVRRASVDGTDQRELWFAKGVGPLPLRVLRRSDGNTIEMQLESLIAQRGQPVPE